MDEGGPTGHHPLESHALHINIDLSLRPKLKSDIEDEEVRSKCSIFNEFTRKGRNVCFLS